MGGGRGAWRGWLGLTSVAVDEALIELSWLLGIVYFVSMMAPATCISRISSFGAPTTLNLPIATRYIHKGTQFTRERYN